MPDLEKSAQESAQDEAQQAAAKPKLPLKMIIIAAGAFLIAIGAFSFVFGVFSSAPAEQTEVNKEATLVKSDTAAGPAASDTIHMDEIARLEREIFGDKKIGKLPVKVKTADRQVSEAAAEEPTPTKEEKDSTDSAAWLKAEKDKLAAERAELEALKRDLEARETRIKSFLEQIDEIESSRINALAKLYDGMQENQVVPLMNKLTDEQAVQILMKMKPANAARILGALKPDRAARISERMLTFTEE